MLLLIGVIYLQGSGGRSLYAVDLSRRHNTIAGANSSHPPASSGFLPWGWSEGLSPAPPSGSVPRGGHTAPQHPTLPSPYPSPFLPTLLLISGDIHPNPGPVFPCSVCSLNVSKSTWSFLCSSCNLWTHLKCSNLPNPRSYTPSWSCPTCNPPGQTCPPPPPPPSPSPLPRHRRQL